MRHITLILASILVAILPKLAHAESLGYADKLRDQCIKRGLDLSERISACSHAIDVRQFQGKDLAEIYLTRSGLYFSKHEREQILPDLDETLKASPDIVPKVVGRAANYRDKKEYDLALEHLDRADKVQPGNWMVLFVRADVRLRRGELELASNDAAAAAQAKPDDVYIQNLQVVIKAVGGDMDGAFSQADRIVALHADSEVGYNTRCYLGALANRDLNKALDDCNTAAKLKPDTPALLDSRGFVYLKLGRYKEAIADYDSAISLRDRPYASSFYGRGMAEKLSGNQVSAAADFSAAESLSPDIGKRFDTPAILAE